jgi:hypothetical protein
MASKSRENNNYYRRLNSGTLDCTGKKMLKKQNNSRAAVGIIHQVANV